MNSAIPHPAFEPVGQHRIDSLDIDIEEYRHQGTGTPHFHLATENTENVFLVGLRTIPEDSTGVAHILEHTVLCGSEKYPVRDPFFMMIRRSLNTFMNAFTSSDWTAYPFATQNRKDYFNLLDVYLDAVFFSRLHKLDFAQEGHRVEFETPDDPESELVYKGVVFNEMKGAMSAPSSVLWQTLSKHLFPNNTYHHNSGGDPEAIPELSYEQLREFYDTHYHPSNAVFMTYGDIPAGELQARFHDHVLQRFEPLGKEISVRKTRRYYAPVRVEEAYPIADDGSDKTHVVVGWLLNESTDLDEKLRSHLVSNLLLDNSASPLMHALETSDLGSSPSPLCGLEDSNREMAFVCGLEGTTPEQAENIEEMILGVFREVAENGIEQDKVDAVLHQLELSQREIRGDGMPFGLQLVLGGLSTAMLRGDTIGAMDLDPALVRLRKSLEDPDFLKNTIRELLLDNPHRVRLTLRPDGSISERRNQAETAQLAAIKSSLDDQQKKAIIEQTKALAERQVQEDDPEILPKVSLDDVPERMDIASGESTTLCDRPAMFYAQGTNGLVYQDIIIDLPQLDSELLALLPYYTGYLTDLGSGGRDYLQTQELQARITGGLGAYTTSRGTIDDPQDVSSYIVLTSKALVRNHKSMSELMEETLQSARFDELSRLRELFAQSRAMREQSITGSGHVLAMSAAASGMSPVSAASHQLNGLAGIASLKQLESQLNNQEKLEAVASKLAQIHQKVMNAPRRFLLIAENSEKETLTDTASKTFKPITDEAFEAAQFTPVREKVEQVWTTNTEVNFSAKAFPTVPSSHQDAAALAVLGPFLRNGYLHRAIRETGGAYGGGASQDADSASFRFYSYRDPRLAETLTDFDQSVKWLKETKHDWRPVEEAILNVVSSIDKPGSPAGRARSAYQSELFHRTPEFREAMRNKILKVTAEDLVRVGDTYLSPEKGSTAVITSEATLKETGDFGFDVRQV